MPDWLLMSMTPPSSLLDSPFYKPSHFYWFSTGKLSLENCLFKSAFLTLGRSVARHGHMVKNLRTNSCQLSSTKLKVSVNMHIYKIGRFFLGF